MLSKYHGNGPRSQKANKVFKKASKVLTENLTSFFDWQPGDFPMRLWQSLKKSQKIVLYYFAKNWAVLRYKKLKFLYFHTKRNATPGLRLAYYKFLPKVSQAISRYLK